MNPFDFVKSINSKTPNIIDENPENERYYDPFIVNRSFSYFPETILYANEMNCNHFLDKKLQHDYLYHGIRKGKRFSKWNTKTTEDTVEFLIRFYECSRRKAEEIARVLPRRTVDRMMKEFPELSNTPF